MADESKKPVETERRFIPPPSKVPYISFSRKKLCPEQLKVLIERAEKDPSLVRGKGLNKAEKAEYNEKWEQLANELNHVKNGTVKTAAKWQQVLRDWRSNTKRKLAKAGEGAADALTTLESKIFDQLGNEPSDVKPPASIDIDNVAELDSLSSEEEMSEDKPLKMVTVYTREPKIESHKRPFSDCEPGTTKKKKMIMVSEDTINRQIEILNRLLSLESSRTEFMHHQARFMKELTEKCKKILQDMQLKVDDEVKIIERFHGLASVYTGVIEESTAVFEKQLGTVDTFSNAMKELKDNFRKMKSEEV